MSRAQQNSTVRRRLVPAVLGLGVVLAIAGCGAGQITQTATQVAAVNGASGQAGPIGLRDAQLAFPSGADKFYASGSNAQVIVTIVNSGGSGDKLVSVSSPAASGATVQGSTEIPAGFSLASGLDTDDRAATMSPLTSSSSSSAATTTSTPSSTAASAGATTSSPTRTSSLPLGTIRITLTGLTQDVRPGQTIKVTFTFQNAGPVTVDVPIGAPATRAAG